MAPELQRGLLGEAVNLRDLQAELGGGLSFRSWWKEAQIFRLNGEGQSRLLGSQRAVPGNKNQGAKDKFAVSSAWACAHICLEVAIAALLYLSP